MQGKEPASAPGLSQLSEQRRVPRGEMSKGAKAMQRFISTEERKERPDVVQFVVIIKGD